MMPLLWNSEFGIRKPPTAANAIQVSRKGGDHEELAGDGASPRAERVSNSDFPSAHRQCALEAENQATQKS